MSKSLGHVNVLLNLVDSLNSVPQAKICHNSLNYFTHFLQVLVLNNTLLTSVWLVGLQFSLLPWTVISGSLKRTRLSVFRRWVENGSLVLFRMEMGILLLMTYRKGYKKDSFLVHKLLSIIYSNSATNKYQYLWFWSVWWKMWVFSLPELSIFITESETVECIVVWLSGRGCFWQSWHTLTQWVCEMSR